MKKIYFTILSGLLFTQIANAQLLLTKIFNEPVIGDVSITHRWDSISTAPLDNSNGPNTFWDFSTLTTNTAVSISNYTTVAGTPSASSYTNATFAEDLGNGGYNYWKSTSTPTTQLELLGIVQPSLSVNLNANSAIAYVWPISYLYSKTDALSGSVSSSTPGVGSTATGNVKTVGSGTGTLVLPGGLTFTNVLQVTSTQTINATITLSVFIPVGTATLISTNYEYYHSSQKFPILTVGYQVITGSFPNNSASIRINNNVIAGIHEATQNFNFSVYPNPATDKLNISLSNKKAENVSIKIVNTIGQVLKIAELGNSTEINHQIDLSTLSSGIYFVKTTVGSSTSSKKIIKE